MYTINFSPTAEKQFFKLETSSQERIIAVLERIKIQPFRYVEKVIGSPYFRLRVGEYRVIVDIKKDKLLILVITVGHRKNIYKRPIP